MTYYDPYNKHWKEIRTMLDKNNVKDMDKTLIALSILNLIDSISNFKE